MSNEANVMAHVLLRSAAGERPGVDVPITAANAARRAAAPGVADAVAAFFRQAGFSVTGHPGGTLGLAGSRAQFEGLFGVELARQGGASYGVKHHAAAAALDATSLPIDRLPPAIRDVVSQVALEAAMSPDEPGVDP
jgi:hypothetical protein